MQCVFFEVAVELLYNIQIKFVGERVKYWTNAHVRVTVGVHVSVLAIR